MSYKKRSWMVCAGVTLLLFTSVGILSNAFTVFQPYIIARGAMTKSQGSLLVTIKSMFTLLTTMAVPFYYRRVTLRCGMVMALIPGALSVLLYSLAADFVFCCIAAALAGLTCGLCCMVPATMVIKHWFFGHRGLALGICSAGTGAAAVIGPPVLQTIMEHAGMERAMQSIVIFYFIAGIITYLLIRDCPEDIGLQPLDSDVLSQQSYEKSETSLQKSRRHTKFLVPAAFLLAGIGGPYINHLTVYMTGAQYDPFVISWMISALGITMTAGKCLLGVCTDWIGGRRACIVLGISAVIGEILTCMIPLCNIPLASCAFLLTGLGMSLTTVGFPIWCSDLCDGNTDLLVRIQTAHMLGSLLMSPVPGILADWSGSYQSAYFLFAGMIISAVVLMLTAYFIHHRNATRTAYN